MGAINQALAANKILKLNDFEVLGMVQSFDWSPALGAQEVYEFGSSGKVDTAYELRTSGSFELTSTGGTAGLLARLLPKRDALTNAFQGYQYDSAGANGKNGYTFNELDVAETRFDILQLERPDGLKFSRSLWLPRCSLATLSGSSRSDGFSSESVSFRGPDVVGFNNPYHDVRAIVATVTDSTHLALADATVDGATSTLAYVYVNDKRIRNGTTADPTTFSLAAGVLTLATTEGYVIPADADCMALVYKTTGAATFPVITSGMRPTTAHYVRGSQVNVYIAPADVDAPTSTEKFLKVQSLDYSIDWGLTELTQLSQNDRGSAIYCLVPTLPLGISCNATVYEGDWMEWQAMLNKSFSGDVYNSTYEFSPSSIKTNFAIVLEYWTKNVPAAKLQTWKFTDMAPQGRGTRTAVRGRGELSWSFIGTKFILQGFNV